MLSALLFAVLQASQVRPAPADTAGFQPLLRFAIDDTTSLFERPLGAALLVRIRRDVNARGKPAGWYTSVIRKSSAPDPFNLLYHSREWHGPYPTDLLAWIHAEQYFPDERVLPVYDYPYELRLRCVDCQTVGRGPEAAFTAGTVDVSVRRLKLPARRT